MLCTLPRSGLFVGGHITRLHQDAQGVINSLECRPKVVSGRLLWLSKNFEYLMILTSIQCGVNGGSLYYLLQTVANSIYRQTQCGEVG